MRSRMSFAVVAAAASLVALALTVSVQGQEPGRQDVLSALLAEVRGLRAAIEQMSSASARVQLAMGRLQIQEQRVNALSQQLAAVRATLSAKEAERGRHESALADLEGVVRDTTDEGERKAIVQSIAELKMMLGISTGDVTKLRAEETELAGLMTAEQSRWIGINEQLEALDRTLSGR